MGFRRSFILRLLSLFRSRLPNRFDIIATTPQNSRTLFEIAIRSGVQRFIFSSTAAVYGNPPANPVTEKTPVAPVSPYGSSKFMAETMLRDAARAHGLRYVILRYFNVAGADPSAHWTGNARGNAS